MRICKKVKSPAKEGAEKVGFARKPNIMQKCGSSKKNFPRIITVLYTISFDFATINLYQVELKFLMKDFLQIN